MLPGHLLAEFWFAVEQQLREQHHLTEQQARSGVGDYRNRLDLHRVGEMVYHNNPEDVAATIAGIIRQGGFDAVDPLPATEPNSSRAVG
jgi:hypothetical protein